MPTKAPDAADAMDLLARVPYGRLAATLRALPFVAPARHVVLPDALLLRMHMGLGYHRACTGTVVAYGSDNLTPPLMDPASMSASASASGSVSTAVEAPDPAWSVQCIGTATIVRPTDEELTLFGAGPRSVDGEPFEPVYLRLVPELTTVHRLVPGSTPSEERQSQHAASTII